MTESNTFGDYSPFQMDASSKPGSLKLLSQCPKEECCIPFW